MTPVYEEIFVDGVKVDTNWNFGYVKADGSIVANGSAYSYTDVIVVPKAGSKVTFTDTNKNGSKFCSNSALVFSTWTKDGENWVFTNGVKGEEGTFSSPAVIYSYTSTKDNELVRLCYRSEEKANAPIDAALRPVVTLKTPVAETPAQPENPTTGDAALNVVAAVLASFALAVTVIKKRTIA